MMTSDLNLAQQIARAAIAFEEACTGHVPSSASVLLRENTLVITLRGALSPAEIALARSAPGAAQVQEFHRQVFQSSVDRLREAIERITGVSVHEGSVEIATPSSAVVQVFATGTVVQVFLLDGNAPEVSWSGTGKEAEGVP